MSTGNISITNGCNVPDVVWNIQPDLNRSGAEWYVGRTNKTLVLVSDYINPLVIRVAGQLRIDIPRNQKSGYTTSAMIMNEKDLEIQKLKRTYDWAISPIKDEELHKARYNFYQFFSEHDKRRGTDFCKTFPEYEEFYHFCKNIII